MYGGLEYSLWTWDRVVRGRGVADGGGGKESHSSQGRAPLDLCAVVMGRLVLYALYGARQFVSGTSSRSIID
jgi:hypothetical protein